MTFKIKDKPFLALLLGVIALAISAQITIQLPLSSTGIPITGQTLAVILVAFFLPRYWGSLAVFIYLILAAFGLPILADGARGFQKFLGGSAGFLFSFLIAALVISRLSISDKSGNLKQGLLLNIIGTSVILIIGNAWLIYKFGWEAGLSYGLYPFWKGAVIKIFLGVLIMAGVGEWKSKRKITIQQ